MKKIWLHTSSTLAAGILLGWLIFGNEKTVQQQVPANVLCAADGSLQAYTCSMHPSVQLAQTGACPLCGMPLIPSSEKPWADPSKLKMSPEAVALAGVATAIVKPTEVVKTIPLQGKVVADESRLYHQVAHFPGRIVKLHVHEDGEYITKGQPLAEIYSREVIGIAETFAYSQNNPAIIRSSRNTLRSWNLTEDDLKDFDVKNNKHYKPVTVRADFSGYVLKKYVNEGDRTSNDYMAEPTRLFDIADLSKVWVEFDVYQEDLRWVKKGDEVTFTVRAYPEKVFTGFVKRISPQVGENSVTTTIRLEVDNPHKLLKPNMLAEGSLRVKPQGSASIQVPATALLWTGERSVVYVQDTAYDMPVFECREVRIAGRMGNDYLIAEGLKAGERVVINGAFVVDAAAELAGKKSMMSLLKDRRAEDDHLAKNE